jgi:hypothetical protein
MLPVIHPYRLNPGPSCHSSSPTTVSTCPSSPESSLLLLKPFLLPVVEMFRELRSQQHP